jgi:hypothetical protein
VQLLKRRLLPLLLMADDLNIVLEFYKPFPLPINVLPPGFSALGRCLSSHDGFLFLTEPLNLLLDSEQLLLFSSLISGGFFLLVLQLDLFELHVFLDDLNW